jgi:hypothetical protein
MNPAEPRGALVRRWMTGWAERPQPGASPLAWRISIETHPELVAFVQTWPGKLLLFALFGALMHTLGGELWLETTLAACGVALAGRRRRPAALVATAALLLLAPHWFQFGAVSAALRQESLEATLSLGGLRTGSLLVFLPLAAAILYLARRFRERAWLRRPVLVQHGVYLALLALAASHALQGVPAVLTWSFLAVFSGYFWFLAYALLDQRRRYPQPLLLQLATFHPFFGSSPVPYGKGANNWSRVEPRSAEDLAVTQLKGFKLMVWALALEVAARGFRWAVYGELGIPPLGSAFESFLETGRAPALGLLSVVANFPEQLLLVAIWGHVIIATARLAGFRLLRNTYRPLSSRSIAEFWNRFYYYFKEILVDVYFYPTYLRWLKHHPRLRIAFATFMAAGVGNFFYHFVRDNHRVAELGLLEALARSQTYGFYCLVLAGGIILSQLRARKPPADAGWLRGQVLPSLGVAVFFCFLSFFDGPGGHAALGQHFEFLLQVLGVARWTG